MLSQSMKFAEISEKFLMVNLEVISLNDRILQFSHLIEIDVLILKGY